MKKTSLYLRLIFILLIITNFFLVNITFNKVIDDFFKESIKNQNLLTIENLKGHILKKEYNQIQAELNLLTEYEIFNKIIIYDYLNEKIFESNKEKEIFEKDLIKEEYSFVNMKKKIATIHFFYEKSNKDEIIETFKDFDYLLVEGLKTLPLPRITIFRDEIDETYFKYSNSIAFDETINKNEIPSNLDKLDLNNPEEIINWIENNAKRV